MARSRGSSVEQLQVVSRFESLKETLAATEYAEHLSTPLAYWALPADRRLPLALLSRTLGELLGAPLRELARTPGIGHKKIASLLMLLDRAANTDPSDLSVDVAVLPLASAPKRTNGEAFGGNGFHPAHVSEVTWSQWRATVVRHGLEREALGRFAPSLKGMARVIWSTPLGAYTDCTLHDIRSMKTHGEKRVRAILDVFHAIHDSLGGLPARQPLVVRILPRRIDEVERWIGGSLQTAGVPREEEIRNEFVHPLLEQIRIDATQQIVALAESRLGLVGEIASVRQVARTMGLTRARVYQLLNEINDIMTVRWPLGRHQVYELREKWQAETARMEDAPDLQQFHAAIELFYPGNRRGAAGPLEQAEAFAVEDHEPVEPCVEAEMAV